MEPFPIMPFLEGMLAYTQLDTFNSVESLDIPPEAMIHVQRMSCTMYTQPIFPPNLIELKMNCEIAFLESCDFAGLALEMITQNAYQKLKKLSLTSDYESNHIDEMYYEEMLFEGRPNWLKFFYVFAQKGIKLNLTALGIEGEFCNAPNDMSADIVSQAVELSDLDTLEIKYENYIHTHPARYREDGVHTCLNDLTKKLPSLRKLSIQHTRVCSEHEIDALNRILRENIPNQLNDLRIYFEDQTSGESESVRRTILNCQKNLAKLTFSHDPPADLLSRHFMGVLGLEDLEQECLDDQYRRNVLSPKILNFSGGKPFVSDEILRSIINCRRKFLSFLRSDSLYKGAAQNLPFLIEYSVLGLRINMRERSIDFRGVCISLEKLALHGDEGDLEMIKG
ncbi:hypothetical protein JCM33374_g1758 [Metschnikowia sp. JCM 33374]|nr:hypothetical protein JCM33374_g1758 [Metschnikowia sp. JCM 33374]